jgi:DNA-binding IclR family transcriptional regulator
MRLVKGLLQRCVEVTELMAGARGAMRLSEIAQALDLPKSATHRLLQELCTLGWIEQGAADGPYRLTLRFGLLGHRVLQATGLLDLAQPVLQQLAARTRELARLTCPVGDELVWLASAQGAPPGLVYQPSMDGPLVLHATANGKAFLACLPDEEAVRRARLGGLGTRRPTPRTLVDGAALLADLARVRARGYALAEEEAELGVTAVAVAVRNGGTGHASPPPLAGLGREADQGWGEGASQSRHLVEATLAPPPPPNLGPLRGPSPQGEGETRCPAILGTVSIAGPTLRLSPARIPALVAELQAAARDLAAIWPQRSTA